MRARLRLPFGTWIKRFMPRSLLGRTLLIMLVPLVLVQAIALQIFYGSHLEHRVAPAVQRDRRGDRLHGGTDAPVPRPRRTRRCILARRMSSSLLDITLEPGAVLAHARGTISWARWTTISRPRWSEKFHVPFTMDWTSDPRSVLIQLQLPDGVLDVEAPRKRLAIGTIFLFVGWLVGSALLLFTIAAVFMRNQVRAIQPAGAVGRGVRHGARRAADPAGRGVGGAAGRRPPSTACRNVSAASWRSGRRCWPACRTTCARR